MIVGLDTSFLLYFVAPAGHVGTPLDANNQPIQFAKERVEGLIAELEKVGAKIIVPTPALSEIMVRAGAQAGQTYIARIKRSKAFKIVPFDEKAAVEVAMMTGNITRGQGLRHATDATHAKLKYDRQIIAIARTEGVQTFYTDDKDQKALAQQAGMLVKGLEDCLVPTVVAQGTLDL